MNKVIQQILQDNEDSWAQFEADMNSLMVKVVSALKDNK